MNLNLIKFIFLLNLFFINLYSDNNLSKNKFNSFFASLRSDKVNIRVGPSFEYDVKFTLSYKNMPILVTNKYDNWYEIQDYEGDYGWVNMNLITKKRYIIFTSNNKLINLYKKPFIKSKIIYKSENKVIAKLISCENKWCKINIKGKNLYVQDKYIWGDDIISIN